MRAPGNLDELPPEGFAAWKERVAAELARALLEVQGHTTLPPTLLVDSSVASELRSVDWPAEPAHAVSCLGRHRAHRLLDWSSDEGAMGRVRFQDEYLEWRAVRQEGRIARFELTTELPEYWETLAAHSPSRTLELVSGFAMKEVAYTDVYGTDLVEDLPLADRASAFRRTMLPGRDSAGDGQTALRTMSRFNNGKDAVCCMIHPDNNLFSLLRLTVSSLRPLLVIDRETGRTRFATGPEAIGALGAIATNGRNSDPLAVERLVRFVTERRYLAFDDPIGVYIRGLQTHALAQPDGSDVPTTWVTMSRGSAPSPSREGSRYQRLTLTVPGDADFTVSDLVVRRTGERLRYGGQLAALVHVAVFIRTSPSPGIERLVANEPNASDVNCELHLAGWHEFDE